jgi:hypothetical protein
MTTKLRVGTATREGARQADSVRANGKTLTVSVPAPP